MPLARSAWYSLCKRTTLPVSIYLYNNDAKYFINFLTRTYSPIILASIFTNGNVTSFFDSYITFFLYFLNTNNVSGYIITFVIMESFYDHYLFACPPTTVLCHTLKHLLHFIHSSPMYTQTIFRNSLLKNDVPTSI